MSGFRAPAASGERTVARFLTRTRGLHAVAWEDVLTALSLPGGDLASSVLMLSTSELRLSRLGVPVPFHVEPRQDRFVPGSTLYFLSEGADAAYAKDAVYELAVAPGGTRMAVGPSSRDRRLTRAPTGFPSSNIIRVTASTGEGNWGCQTPYNA